MKRAVYPGSFDPMTLGHVDILKRLSHHFDKIFVLVAKAQHKDYLFSNQERVDMAREELEDLENIEVVSHRGLTVDFAKENEAFVILRGLRAVSDFEYEMSMGNLNRRLAPEIETMIVFSRPEYSAISSRGVKEIARYGGQLDGMVSAKVAEKLNQKVQE